MTKTEPKTEPTEVDADLGEIKSPRTRASEKLWKIYGDSPRFREALLSWLDELDDGPARNESGGFNLVRWDPSPRVIEEILAPGFCGPAGRRLEDRLAHPNTTHNVRGGQRT